MLFRDLFAPSPHETSFSWISLINVIWWKCADHCALCKSTTRKKNHENSSSLVDSISNILDIMEKIINETNWECKCYEHFLSIWRVMCYFVFSPFLIRRSFSKLKLLIFMKYSFRASFLSSVTAKDFPCFHFSFSHKARFMPHDFSKCVLCNRKIFTIFYIEWIGNEFSKQEILIQTLDFRIQIFYAFDKFK